MTLIMTTSTINNADNGSLSQANLTTDVTDNYKQWKKLRRLNQGFDVGLTLSTILLTLIVTILGTEGIKLDDNFRKGSIGILGGVIITTQSIATKFGIRKKAEGYRNIEAKAIVLQNDLDIAANHDQLLEIHKKLNDLIMEAAGIERGD
jgi:hypothetical protein